MRQSSGVTLCNQQAGFLGAHKFRNASHGCSDDGQLASHSLHQHDRDSVSIAVTSHNAGQDKNIAALEEVEDLILVPRPEQAYVSLQPMLVHESLQRVLKRAGSHDLTLKIQATAG